MPEIPELKLVEWLEAVLGEEAVEACPQCGARGRLFKLVEFERLPWWVLVVLGLVSRPTLPGGVPLKGMRGK